MKSYLWALSSAFGAAIFLGMIGASSVLGQAMPPQQGAGQGSNVGNPYSGYGSDYPAPEVQAVPMAFARAVAARAQQDLMLADLHSTVDRIREDFNYSPEMLAATREQNSALDAYDEARWKVLGKLSDDPTYRAMISLVVSLKQKLEDERPGLKPTEAEMERLLATATLKLSYASAASAMEVAALSADADVMQTHARLLEAADKVAILRADFERKIRRDPEFLAARRNLDDARIANLTADAFLSGALDARSVAMDYAYSLHQFNPYSASPSITVGYTPYPYGYGYGYGGGYGNGYGNHDHYR